MNYIYISLIVGFCALLFAFWKYWWVMRQDPGSEKMQNIGRYIAEGSLAFLY